MHRSIVLVFVMTALSFATGCGAAASANAGASINSDGTVSADADAEVDTPAGTFGAGAAASTGPGGSSQGAYASNPYGGGPATRTAGGYSVDRAAYAQPTPGYATVGGCREEWVHMPMVLNFPTGGATLDAQSRLVLREMVRSAQTRDDLVAVRVEGHTDRCGRELHNQALSQQRAQSVANELVSMGVPSERVHSVGYGSTQPRANERCGGYAREGLSRSMNRRVEFSLLVCR